MGARSMLDMNCLFQNSYWPAEASFVRVPGLNLPLALYCLPAAYLRAALGLWLSDIDIPFLMSDMFWC